MKMFLSLILSIIVLHVTKAQHVPIPSSYTNIKYDESKRLYFEKEGQKFYADTSGPEYTINQLLGNPKGTQEGVEFNFGVLKGTITYGFVPYTTSILPTTVFRSSTALQNGKAAIDVNKILKDSYGMAGIEEKAQLAIGYRLQNEKGTILYDGVLSITGRGPFTVVPTIYNGPYVNNISDNSAVIWFETQLPVKATVVVGGKKFGDNEEVLHHEITLSGLKANTDYKYTVQYGSQSQGYSFKTAPLPGSRKPFVFAFTSDCRQALGGGERNIYGTNAYVMKKMAALAYQNKAAFFQFTGDMVSGYKIRKEELSLQLINWRKSVEPFWHYMPFYVGQGNHESLGYSFLNPSGKQIAYIDRFPYKTESAEAIIGQSFVAPLNGPDSEDGNKYDKNLNTTDFPTYKENVFYYTHDNVAMIVLNSSYWYSSHADTETATSGGLFGYIQDNQLKWLQQTVQQLEKDKAIDHVFVTLHTPVFPNGGHVGDGMWYDGNNQQRPYISGKPVDKGIMERRDEFLDILINQSKKVVAVLAGHEHSYNRLELTRDVQIYPDNYPFKKLNISRPIFQIINGAAGAPYYTQEKTPWSAQTKAFTIENALCLFYVEGKNVNMKVINPDTLNPIDELKLR